MPALDVDALRADTPATAHLIHLDNAGSSLPPQPVVEAVVDYVRAEAAIGGYRAQEALADRIDDFYAATATMLGCDREEVSFCGGASEAWWRAFTAFPLRPGDRVVAGSSEFQANAFGLLQARDRGVIVEIVPDDDDGVIDLAALGDLLEPPTRLIALTMVSMSNGAVQPAAEVGALARAAGLPYLLDACQVAGQRPLDVDALGCDALVYTGRKFMRGPRGTGVLYVRRSIRDRLGVIPFVDGRSAEWLDDGGWEAHDGSAAFEFGEQHYAGKVGLAVATRYALDTGLERIAARIGALADRFRNELADLGGVRVLDRGRDRCGIVTFGVDGHAADHVGKRLRDNSINVSTPGRRNAQWDIGARGIDAVVRAGIHCFNTEDEIDRTLEVVASLSSPRC